MKKLLLFLITLSSCTPKTTLPGTSFLNVFPVRHGTVTYFTAFKRAATPADEANARTRQWVNRNFALFNFLPMAPVVDQHDLFYAGKIPGRRLSDETGGHTRLPDVSFYLTVNNSPDSTKMWITNVELRGKSGWLPIEQYKQTGQDEYVTMWLQNIDAAFSEMIGSIKERLGSQTALRN